MCGRPDAAYQVNPEDRSCRACLVDVIDTHFDGWDGFAPVTVSRIRTGGAA